MTHKKHPFVSTSIFMACYPELMLLAIFLLGLLIQFVDLRYVHKGWGNTTAAEQSQYPQISAPTRHYSP